MGAGPPAGGAGRRGRARRDESDMKMKDDRATTRRVGNAHHASGRTHQRLMGNAQPTAFTVTRIVLAIILSASLLAGCIGSPANPAATQPTTQVSPETAK